jgi:hypothetical protein
MGLALSRRGGADAPRGRCRAAASPLQMRVLACGRTSCSRLLGRRPWAVTAAGDRAAGALGVLAALVWPARRRALAEALGATALRLPRPALAYPWQAGWGGSPWPRPALLARRGAGRGLLGLLPAAALLLLLGRPLFPCRPAPSGVDG